MRLTEKISNIWLNEIAIILLAVDKHKIMITEFWLLYVTRYYSFGRFCHVFRDCLPFYNYNTHDKKKRKSKVSKENGVMIQFTSPQAIIRNELRLS